MAISTEGKLGILAGLVGIGGAGAIMVWPDHVEIGWTLIGIATVGGIMLAAHHFRDVHRDREQKGRMVALAGFIVFGLVSLACGYWYFRPASAPAVPDANAVARLAALGWTVQPSQAGQDQIQFAVSSKPLPPMKESSDFFRQLRAPFRLQFQLVKSIDGLHYLSGIQQLIAIGINAGEFTDLSELHSLTSLESLDISQTPYNGRESVDISPLASLINLHRLHIGDTKATSLEPLRNLKKLRFLYLRDTWISDLSPISEFPELEFLDITDTRATDLHALSESKNLTELGAGSSQIPGLVSLGHLQSLKTLRVITRNEIDLVPIGGLINLEDLWIWGAPRFNLAPLRHFTKLRKLQLTGPALSGLSAVTRPTNFAELRMRFLIRHARNGAQTERPGGCGKEEVLRHLSNSPFRRHL
jgi:hypothetical protein